MSYKQPDQQGHFDTFGGKYVPETLIPAINELEKLELENEPNAINRERVKEV